MLENTYTIEAKTKGEYKLRLPVDADWQNKEQRVLIILETVDSEDIVEKRLLYKRSRTVLENLLKFSFTRAKDHGFVRRDCAFAAINFNNVKFMDKPRETWPVYKEQFRKRIRDAIAYLEPTHILISGDHAAESILSESGIDYIPKKRGWVYDLTIKKVRVKVCTTLDLNPLYTAKKNEDTDDDDFDDGDIGKDVYAKSNLLFYVSDHVQNLLCGKLIYDLSGIVAKPKYIDTIEKFDEFFKKLKAAPIVALDTETRNGTVNHNAIHTIQFGFGTKVGYVLPYKHPQTPFTPKEVRYIGKRLRKFLMAKPGEYAIEYLITQYGMFDLRICRKEFGIPIIHHPVWEITAGEYCFGKGTVVSTEHGDMLIEDLVTADVKPRVWSRNQVTGKDELKEIIGTSEHSTTQRMFEIEYEGGVLRVTEDHKIWSVTRQAYVMAKDLTVDDELLLQQAPPRES